MTHMSFHGALGNMTAADPAMAEPLVEAVARFDPGLTISSSTSRAIEDAAARCGLRVATTFLADRACDRDGLLVPRDKPGAVIHDEAAVLARVERLLKEGVVETWDGTLLPREARKHPPARRYAGRGRLGQVLAGAGGECRLDGHARFATAQIVGLRT